MLIECHKELQKGQGHYGFSCHGESTGAQPQPSQHNYRKSLYISTVVPFHLMKR